MKHDHPDTQNNLTPHPADPELLSYMAGRLDDTAGEAVQRHLVECDQCLDVFKDMHEFFDAQRPDEQMISEDMATEWTSLWKRLQESKEKRAGASYSVLQVSEVESLEPRPVDRRDESRTGARPYSAAILAIAAMLLVMFALGFWALNQRQQKHELAARLESAEKQAAQMQAEREALAGRLNQSEQEKLELQERARLATESRGSQPLETRKPELNVPIYDLYARSFSRRSGNESELNRIKAPAGANSMVLILNGEGVVSSPSYGIEIVNDRGRVIWRGNGLKKGHLGNLTITVDRTLLPNGNYRFKLSGDGQSNAPLAEYVLRIE